MHYVTSYISGYIRFRSELTKALPFGTDDSFWSLSSRCFGSVLSRVLLHYSTNRRHYPFWNCHKPMRICMVILLGWLSTKRMQLTSESSLDSQPCTEIQFTLVWVFLLCWSWDIIMQVIPGMFYLFFNLFLSLSKKYPVSLYVVRRIVLSKMLGS
jgi:hypothetical protein